MDIWGNSRIFELRSKIGCISEIKINLYLFCISLDLHYLCSRRNQIARIMTATMLRSRLESRWSSLKYLDDDSKLDLITMLTQSLKDSGNRKKISASEFYGIWGDDGMSDDEFVEALQAERKFNQEIVEI